jgi:valyl-tRNA synthetase
MHPFIPFVTEELWQKFPKPSSRPGSIVVAPFPTVANLGAAGALRDDAAEREMAALQGVISSIRTIRTEHEISPAATVSVRLCTSNAELRALLQREQVAIRTLAKVDPLEILPGDAGRPSGFATSSAGEIEVQVLLKGLVDSAHEAARIERELKRIDKDLQGMEKKLSQPSFTEKAPPEVVAESRARLAELQTARARLEAGRGLIDELKG